MSVRAHPEVFTIPAGRPFLRLIARRLLAETGGDTLSLADYLVLLPTQRACRAMQEAFLVESGGRASILPRLVPIGDIDEDEFVLTSLPEAGLEAALDLPPAVPELRRRLLLARLIVEEFERRDGTAPPPEQAAALARALASFLDEVQIERLDFSRLATLVPEAFAEHWQRTLEVLQFVTESWPTHLAGLPALDPVERRNRLMAALVARWHDGPPAHPVLAAGSTGSIPATADLLLTVARLPQGRVVLPGLDRVLDETAWTRLDVTHPQYHLARLLDRLGLSRDGVADWPGADDSSPTRRARAHLASEALRPAATTAAWRDAKVDRVAALEGVLRIDCAGPREEAGVIALLMREALAVPERTCALVTPDRQLARRVAGELRRWGIDVDDSGGTPLADTVPGAYLRLLARLLDEGAAPVPLLALLKHPLAAGGLAPGVFRARVRALEYRVLHGPRPGDGLRGIAHLLRHNGDRHEDDEERTVLASWFEGVAGILSPFLELASRRALGLRELAEAHLRTAEALAATHDEDGAARLWKGDAGEAAALLMAEMLDAASDFGLVAAPSYAPLLEELMRGRVVRARFSRHPRLHIWGPLEARLQSADRLILGGLNEGTWPPEVAADPWMSRPMREAFGLPSAERRIGLSAHDFVEGFSAPQVILTRAARVEGTPTVPSRWLMRLDAVLGVDPAGGSPFPHWNGAAAERYRAWQRLLDRPLGPGPVRRPAPKPPLKARPRELPVTAIETWMADPYAVYARHILNLKPLEPLDADPEAAERGKIVHRVLDRFVRTFPDRLPDDALERLLDLGREVFGDMLDRPTVWAFWWPRFEAVARWFIENERVRRATHAFVAAECAGRLSFDAPGGSFTLTARADRIDRLADGRLAILDYKTGSVPTLPKVEAGEAPQLPLEAAIAEAGGFEGVPAAPVAELAHWRLTGGDPPGEARPLGKDPSELAAAAREGLVRLVAAFDDPSVPYYAAPDPALDGGGDYDHLARKSEWLATETEGEGGDG